VSQNVSPPRESSPHEILLAAGLTRDATLVELPMFRCLQATLVVGFAFSLDSEMAAGLLYVICVPGGGLAYLVATLQSSTTSRTISATVNLVSTYAVIRMIAFNRYLQITSLYFNSRQTAYEKYTYYILSK